MLGKEIYGTLTSREIENHSYVNQFYTLLVTMKKILLYLLT